MQRKVIPFQTCVQLLGSLVLPCTATSKTLNRSPNCQNSRSRNFQIYNISCFGLSITMNIKDFWMGTIHILRNHLSASFIQFCHGSLQPMNNPVRSPLFLIRKFLCLMYTPLYFLSLKEYNHDTCFMRSQRVLALSCGESYADWSRIH